MKTLVLSFVPTKSDSDVTVTYALFTVVKLIINLYTPLELTDRINTQVIYRF